jgi:dethiobiotin synthetase
MTTPRTLVVVAGTGTGVGKTFVGAELVRRLRAAGLRVAARKPAQSYEPDELGATDAEVLAGATGEAPHDVCPPTRWYPVPMAPPMAASQLGHAPPRLHDLADDCTRSWPAAQVDVGLVELAGGPRSPIAADGDGVDLTRLLQPDHVLLVADAGLGTINAVRLSAAVFGGLDVVVMLNRFEPHDALHAANLAWLRGALPCPVLHDVDDLVDHLR